MTVESRAEWQKKLKLPLIIIHSNYFIPELIFLLNINIIDLTKKDLEMIQIFFDFY